MIGCHGSIQWADIIKQGVKTIGRHLVRQRSLTDAIHAGVGLSKAMIAGRDPYGCLPEMISKEKALDVKASYQVAVGHHHPVDVNYYIAKGQQMRSEVLGEMLKSLFAHLRPAGLKMPHLPLNAHFRH